MLKLSLAVLAVAALPGLAMAQGCGHAKTTAMSCADGAKPDPQTGACVPVTTS